MNPIYRPIDLHPCNNINSLYCKFKSKVRTKTPQPLCLEPLEVWGCDRPVQHPSPGVLHLLDDVGTVVDDLSLHACFAAAGWVVRGLVWGAGAHAATAHLLHSICVYSHPTQQIHTVDTVSVCTATTCSKYTQWTQCLCVQQPHATNTHSGHSACVYCNHTQQIQWTQSLCVQQPHAANTHSRHSLCVQQPCRVCHI